MEYIHTYHKCINILDKKFSMVRVVKNTPVFLLDIERNREKEWDFYSLSEFHFWRNFGDLKWEDEDWCFFCLLRWWNMLTLPAVYLDHKKMTWILLENKSRKSAFIEISAVRTEWKCLKLSVKFETKAVNIFK